MPPGPRGPNPRWRSASCLALSARNFLRSFLLSASLTTSSRPLMRRCDSAAIASLPRSGSRNIAIAKPRLLPSSSVASTRSSRSGKLERSILTCSTVVRLSRLPMKILNMPVRAPESVRRGSRGSATNVERGRSKEMRSVAAASGNRFPQSGRDHTQCASTGSLHTETGALPGADAHPATDAPAGADAQPKKEKGPARFP